MPNILSDDTGHDLLQLIQDRKDRGEIPEAAVNLVNPEEAFFKLTVDLGDDLWEADEQERSSSLNSWEDLTGGRSFDSDVPLLLAGGVVDQIVKAVPSQDTSGDPIWIGIALSGGAQRPYIKITTSTDVNNYIANVITPTSATIIESAVTVKALEPDAGQKLPVGREMFADIVDGIYYIQPAVAYGS